MKELPLYDFEKESVKFIRGGRYPFCHSVLIDDQTRAVIDAASDREKLTAFKNQGLVDYLINTHAHEDHLVFNFLFPNSKFCAHPEDAPHFACLDSLIDCYGDMSEADHKKWHAFIEEECHFHPRKVDLFLDGRMTLNFGKTRMEVIHAPGHTRGHCAFYFPGEKILFLGDYDLTRTGPYYGDRGSSIEDSLQSLERLKGYKAETYLTGHGKGIYEADPALIDRYLQIIHLRENNLLELLKNGPKTFDQIVKEWIIYGKDPASLGPWDFLISERMMIAKHLSRLLNQGRVLKEGNFFVFAR
jgi:glyoxylase-like metal-dependent hydrolase (beta-lactamase superfamily II)